MVDVAADLSVIDIAPDRMEEAAEVLELAFARDPLMRWVFASNETAYTARLRALMQRSCMVQLARHLPLKGIVKDDQLVGVANISPPELPRSPFPPSLLATAVEFFSFIGAQATQRLAVYDQLDEVKRIAEPHFSLSTIGIRPEAQGLGYGRILLDAVHLLSQTHPTSGGVLLDTENPANVPWYQHFGYELREHTTLDTLDVWVLFRPNSPAR